jgi:hypothetical protein
LQPSSPYRPNMEAHLMRRNPASLFVPGFLTLAAAIVGIASTEQPTHGDVIILRDGYALHGKLGAEQEVVSDPLTGILIDVKKASGFTSMDDGPRWTVFSVNYKRVGEVNPFNKFEGHDKWTFPAKFGQLGTSKNMEKYKEDTEFDGRWRRTLYYRDSLRPKELYTIEQQIDILTPHYVRVVSTSHFWTNYYLTRELGPDVVRKLLYSHRDLKEHSGNWWFRLLHVGQRPWADVGKRAHIIRFLIQADWLAEADEEIDRMLVDLPNESKRAEELRDEVRTLRIEKTIAEIEQAKEGGRHSFAQSALKSLPKEKVPVKSVLKIAALRAEYDAVVQKLEKAGRFLKQFRDEVKAPAFAELVKAAELIESELHLDSVNRLDLFVTLAEQAENARKAGKAPKDAPEQLLAAAVCGWLMGNNATETNVATARRRLKARDVAIEFLRDASAQNRRAILNAYELDTNALPFDELEKLISLLPPPEAEKNLTETPMALKTPRLSGQADGVRYLVQLPPEYQHNRPYPLLLAFPSGYESTTKCLERLRDLAGTNGYIVAVMDWKNGGANAVYDFKDEEPQIQAMGLLRHLRRTFQIDSDKVFLFGYEHGANLAMDLGACHPGDFAGVVPMCPWPDPKVFSGLEHWKNFQNLPIYMIAGDKIGQPVADIRRVLSSWVAAGYPALCAIYKGRGFEFFEAELPYVFDWMSRKKRASALPDLGRQLHEYRTVRASSNQFFWVSSSDIDTKHIRSSNARVENPARVHAHIVEGNKINVEVFGMKQLTIWLGRESVDFAKPVAVRIDRLSSSSIPGNWSKLLTPRISVLLEDLYERGDRQRPYYQKIDCQDVQKSIKFSAP